MSLVITNCTNRKRMGSEIGLSADALDCGEAKQVVAQWLARLKDARATTMAKDLYCGRSFREAEASAHELKASFYVVSAGLAIVNARDIVPHYDLTVASSPSNNVLRKISGNLPPQAWWSAISNGSPFGSSLATTLARHPGEQVLIALSRPYVELLYDELVELPTTDIKRIHFFGKSLERALPAKLVRNWMPYDDRLDVAGFGYNGTQTDFAQRALRHFVVEMLPSFESNDLDVHRANVLSVLDPLVQRKIPTRTRLDDEAIGLAIRANWSHGKGQSSELLRILRRELGIACEQSRFKSIYHSVRKTIGAPL